jgi:cell shape-determining protein MreC
MDESKARIADMVSSMDFERKKPVTNQTKLDVNELSNSLTEVRKRLDKLSLSLWHAQDKSDYRAISVDQVKEELAKAREELDEALRK